MDRLDNWPFRNLFLFQIGIFLQNSLVNRFAQLKVFAHFISVGILFQILAALMQKLLSPISVLALSYSSLLELSLSTRSEFVIWLSLFIG